MSSREDNYSRCVCRDRYGKKKVYKTLGKAQCDATQKRSLILVAIKH